MIASFETNLCSSSPWIGCVWHGGFPSCWPAAGQSNWRHRPGGQRHLSHCFWWEFWWTSWSWWPGACWPLRWLSSLVAFEVSFYLMLANITLITLTSHSIVNSSLNLEGQDMLQEAKASFQLVTVERIPLQKSILLPVPVCLLFFTWTWERLGLDLCKELAFYIFRSINWNVTFIWKNFLRPDSGRNI